MSMERQKSADQTLGRIIVIEQNLSGWISLHHDDRRKNLDHSTLQTQRRHRNSWNRWNVIVALEIVLRQCTFWKDSFHYRRNAAVVLGHDLRPVERNRRANDPLAETNSPRFKQMWTNKCDESNGGARISRSEFPVERQSRVDRNRCSDRNEFIVSTRLVDAIDDFDVFFCFVNSPSNILVSFLDDEFSHCTPMRSVADRQSNRFSHVDVQRNDLYVSFARTERTAAATGRHESSPSRHDLSSASWNPE